MKIIPMDPALAEAAKALNLPGAAQRQKGADERSHLPFLQTPTYVFFSFANYRLL